MKVGIIKSESYTSFALNVEAVRHLDFLYGRGMLRNTLEAFCRLLAQYISIIKYLMAQLREYCRRDNRISFL